MVGNEVDDHLEFQFPGAGQEGIEVVERAEQGVDIAVVADVVAEVGHRRAVEWGQPDRLDAEVGDVVQSGGDAGEVTHHGASMRIRAR